MCLCCSVSDILSCCRIGCMGTFVKWLMVLANILLSLTGLIFIGLGAAFLILEKTVLAWIPWWKVTLYAVPLITTGCLIYIITILGCFGAWKEWRTPLLGYVVILAVLVVSQVYLVVVTWGKMDQVQNITQTWVDKAFNKPEWKEAFHFLEVSMECCGSEGSSSYKALKQELPPSCCEDPVPVEEESKVLTCRSGDAYDGCAEVVPPYLQKLADYAGSSIYYVIGVEVLAIFAASYLFKAVSPD